MHKKEKGSIGELAVAAELARKGWRVLFPYGENCRYDLAIERDGIFKRIQVKYSTPKNGMLRINCRSSNNWSVLRYTSNEIDWYAVFDPISCKVFFVPISDVNNRAVINIRIADAKNNQRNKIRFAQDYTEIR